MNKIKLIIILTTTVLTACAQNNNNIKNMNYNKLTKEEEQVIVYKGTERPFTGKYYNHFEKGIYLCKRCGSALYNSSDKFESDCGWPSFDDEIEGAVKRIPDADGRRIEIICNNCGGHLGHVFEGEHFTSKNTRHCVNSISLEFIAAGTEIEAKTDTAIFAGGCFWGVEFFFQKEKGVISTEVGYIGGDLKNPTYKDVCNHNSGHAEAIRIVFDKSKTNFETLAKLFFEIHDPTQLNRQGPDIGDQYRSEIFYLNEQQKQTSEKLITILRNNGYKIVTKLTKATTFWIAEDYHQQYYEHKGSKPYCHAYTKRF